MGDDSAPVTVRVWEDFACPHCRTFHTDVFPTLVADYVEPGDAQYIHHDFPIPVQDWSWTVANTGRGVLQIADASAFFEYVDQIYANQDSFSMALLQDIVSSVVTDPCPPLIAGEDRLYQEVIREDRETGSQNGVSGTPGVTVNGSLVEYERLEPEPFVNAIEDAL